VPQDAVLISSAWAGAPGRCRPSSTPSGGICSIGAIASPPPIAWPASAVEIDVAQLYDNFTISVLLLARGMRDSWSTGESGTVLSKAAEESRRRRRCRSTPGAGTFRVVQQGWPHVVDEGGEQVRGRRHRKVATAPAHVSSRRGIQSKSSCLILGNEPARSATTIDDGQARSWTACCTPASSLQRCDRLRTSALPVSRFARQLLGTSATWVEAEHGRRGLLLRLSSVSVQRRLARKCAVNTVALVKARRPARR